MFPTRYTSGHIGRRAMLSARFRVALAAHERIQRVILGVCENRDDDGGAEPLHVANVINDKADREGRLVLWALYDSAARIVQEEIRYYARFRMTIKHYQRQYKWPTTTKSTCGLTRGEDAVSAFATYTTGLPDTSAAGDDFVKQAGTDRTPNNMISSMAFSGLGPVDSEARSGLVDRSANALTPATPGTRLNTASWTSNGTRNNTASGTVSNPTSRGTCTPSKSSPTEPWSSPPHSAGAANFWHDDGTLAEDVSVRGFGDGVTAERTPVGLDTGGNNHWSGWRRVIDSNDIGAERNEENRHYSTSSKRQYSNKPTRTCSVFGNGATGGDRPVEGFGWRNGLSVRQIGAGGGRHLMLLPSEERKKR